MRRIFNFSKDFGHELGAVVCDALGERDGGGKGVARDVRRERLAKVQPALDLVQVGVRALVGDVRKPAAVSRQDGGGGRQQWREEARAGLAARSVYKTRAGDVDDLEELDALAV